MIDHDDFFWTTFRVSCIETDDGRIVVLDSKHIDRPFGLTVAGAERLARDLLECAHHDA